MYKCKCGSVQFKATATITADATVTTKSGQAELLAGTQNTKDISLSGSFKCVECGAIRLSVDEPEVGSSVRRCACGNTLFTASQRCYHDIIVNGDNIFERNIEISYVESPYGPYCCTDCGAEYEHLSDLDTLREEIK